MATTPEAQRQGIGAVMNAFPLREARALGNTVGVLEALEMVKDVIVLWAFKNTAGLVSTASDQKVSGPI